LENHSDVGLQLVKYFRTIGVRQTDVQVLDRCHVWEDTGQTSGPSSYL